MTPCQYFDEDEFTRKNRASGECLNIFSLNIRSLPKHGGELLHFLKCLNARFGVIILTKSGSKNVSVVDKLIPDYNFHYILPTKSKCEGVGIYTCNSLTSVAAKNGIKIGKSSDCVKCETEGLFIIFYIGTAYTIGGIYRHRNGNVSHFITDLEIVLNQIDYDKTTVLAETWT